MKIKKLININDVAKIVAKEKSKNKNSPLPWGI